MGKASEKFMKSFDLTYLESLDDNGVLVVQDAGYVLVFDRSNILF